MRARKVSGITLRGKVKKESSGEGSSEGMANIGEKFSSVLLEVMIEVVANQILKEDGRKKRRWQKALALVDLLGDRFGEHIPHLSILVTCSYLFLTKSNESEMKRLKELISTLEQLKHRLTTSFQMLHEACTKLTMDAKCLLVMLEVKGKGERAGRRVLKDLFRHDDSDNEELQLLRQWVDEKKKAILSTMSRRFEGRHTLEDFYAKLLSFKDLVMGVMPRPAIYSLVSNLLQMEEGGGYEEERRSREEQRQQEEEKDDDKEEKMEMDEEEEDVILIPTGEATQESASQSQPLNLWRTEEQPQVMAVTEEEEEEEDEEVVVDEEEEENETEVAVEVGGQVRQDRPQLHLQKVKRNEVQDVASSSAAVASSSGAVASTSAAVSAPSSSRASSYLIRPRKPVVVQDTWSSDESDEILTPPSQLPKASQAYKRRNRSSLISSDRPERETVTRRKKWTNQNVDTLIKGVNTYGEGRWTAISKIFTSEFTPDPTQIKDKWRNLQRYNVVKWVHGRWARHS